MNSKGLKLLSAAIGGSAVVAMSGLAVSINQEQSVPDMVQASGMHMGETITQTHAPTAIRTPIAVPANRDPIDMNVGPTMTRALHAPTAMETPMAKPSITGPAPLPIEQQNAM